MVVQLRLNEMSLSTCKGYFTMRILYDHNFKSNSDDYKLKQLTLTCN